MFLGIGWKESDLAMECSVRPCALNMSQAGNFKEVEVHRAQPPLAFFMQITQREDVYLINESKQLMKQDNR